MRVHATLIVYVLFCFTGWSLPFAQIGDVSEQADAILLTTLVKPTETVTFGRGVTFSSHDAVPVFQIEPFLGVADNTLQSTALALYPSICCGYPTEGSAITYTLNAHAGEMYSFQWNFLSNGGLGNADDFAFLTYVSDTAHFSTVLGSMETLIGPSLITLVEEPAFANGPTRESGFSTYSLTFPTDGRYTVGIGIVEMLDYYTASGLEVRNVRVPDGGNAFFLLVLSLILMFFDRRKRSAKASTV